MVWISRWQQAPSALDKGARRTVVLASPAETDTGRRSDAVPAQVAAETFASVQAAIVASTLMATTSCALRAVAVLVTFALLSRKDDSMAFGVAMFHRLSAVGDHMRVPLQYLVAVSKPFQTRCH